MRIIDTPRVLLILALSTYALLLRRLASPLSPALVAEGVYLWKDLEVCTVAA